MSNGRSTTPEPTEEPTTKPMIGSQPGGTSSAGDRAQEMRGTLKVRQEAEALLAEATQLRQRAVADADTMVADAEQLAGELVYEARNTAQRIVAEAQERAEGIVAVARHEADEMREQTDREREQLRAAVVTAVRDDVESAHDGLRAATPVLHEAIASVAGALSALEVLRDDDWTAPRVLEPVGPQTVADPGAEPDEPEQPEQPEQPVERITSLPDEPRGASGGEPDDEARPLGWLFRANQG